MTHVVPTFCAQVTPRRLTFVALTAIGALLVPGVLQLLGTATIPAFDYNAEQNVPVVLSSGLLLLAAWACASWANEVTATQNRFAVRLLALVFAFMAVDDAGQLHEKLERVAGVDWQVLYVPVMGIAGFAALRSMHALASRPRARGLLWAGAVCWAAAGVLEFIQYDGNDRRVAGFDVMVFFEENLELLGAFLFSLTFVVALQHSTKRRTARVDAKRAGASRTPELDAA